MPNVSEGRDTSVLQAIESAIQASGCRLVDTHTDPDHHRTVYTMVGSPQAIRQGAIALAKCAVALIDLRSHCGVHPRLGAVDVIPFVPLGSSTMLDCVSAARDVGQSIAEECGLPVYLYGEAARLTGQAALPQIRRGGFEALAERMPTNPPDYGPTRPHPTAGAVAVGARDLLVAYNVVLRTSDLGVAEDIASAIRESNGGLPGVRSLGFPLASRALVQVSMNLTNVRATSLRDAFCFVADRAEALGVSVHSSEIVGLIPDESIADATTDELLLQDDLMAHRLEAHVAEAWHA